MTSENNFKGPVLHVVVVGFHHKKGCQVEYSYPPLIAGNPVDSPRLPKEWKNLPSLALPDGAHNFTNDTVYFHLPALAGNTGTIYGVSCYRQIDASKLIKRGSDVTRNTVQKSVCVLSKLPLYGLIQAKLELITHAYFKELDFTQVSLLEETHRNLNHGLTESLLQGTQLFLGLSVRGMVQDFKHNILVLFKLLLLEKRILFFGSPALRVSSAVLTLASLIPGMLELGLCDCASYSHKKPAVRVTGVENGEEGYIEVHYNRSNSEDQCDSLSSSVMSNTSQNLVASNVLSSSTPKIKIHSDKVLDGPGVHHKFNRSMSHGPRVEGLNGVPSVFDSSDSEQSSGDGSSRSFKSPYNSHDHFIHALPSDRKPKSPNTVFKIGQKDDHPDIDVKALQASLLEPAKSIDINTITHVETVQDVQNSNQSDASLLRESRHESESDKIDPLQFVEDVTSLKRVQASFTDFQEHASNKVAAAFRRPPLIEKASSISSHDSDLTHQEQQMLDDECFNWEEDKLLLEINDVIEGTSTPTYRRSGDNSPQMCDNMPIVHTKQPHATGEHTVKTPDLSNPKSLTIDRCESNTSLSSRGSTSRGIDSISTKASEIRSRLYDKLTMLDSDDTLLRMTPPPASSIVPDENGLPLAIFTKGMLLHPYLSLQFYDLLQEVNIRGFIIGASNILYKQKKHLVDVIVDVSEAKIDIYDNELKKQLDLTTADLRFADFLVKGVGLEEQEDNIYISDTGWEGGDDWLRSQFKSYLLGLMAVQHQHVMDQQDDYNNDFIQAWTTTSNYKLWHSASHEGLQNVVPCHPCHGNLSVSDMKLKIALSMNNTERGQKINAAVAQTGRVVAQTGKVVGVALNSARSAVSSLFNVFGSNSNENNTTDNS